jgi:hypothetical protein
MTFKRGPAPIILLMLIMVFGGAVVFSLPVLLERKIFPEIMENSGLHEYGIDVRRIGIAGIDIGRVWLGDGQAPWLSIASIQVDYSMTGILAREIRSVTVSGLEIEALVQDGRIVIPGLAMTEQADSGPGDDRFLRLPVDIGSLTVRNATLAVVYNGKRLTVPFSLHIKKNNDAIIGQSVPVYDCDLQLRPRGQLVRIRAHVNLANNRVETNYAADSLQLEVFADLLSGVVPLSLAGKTTILGTTSFQISPLRLIDIDAQCKVSGARITANAFSLQNRSFPGHPETPLQVQLRGNSEKVLVKVEDLVAVRPFPVQIPTMISSISYAASAIELDGNVQLDFTGLPQVWMPETHTTPLRAALDFNGAYTTSSTDWRLEITSPEDHPGRPAPQFSDRSETLAVVPENVALTIAAQGSGAMGKIEYSLQLAGQSVSFGGADVWVPSVSLTGHTTIENTVFTRAEIHLPGTTLTAGSMRAQGDIRVVGITQSASQETTPESQSVGFQGTIEFNNVSAADQETGISVNTMNAEIPFQWPPPAAVGQGAVTIKDIRWQDKQLGSLNAAVQQEGAGFAIDGIHENRLMSGLSLHFNGQATYDGAEGPAAAMQFKTKTATDTVEADLGSLHPSLQGFSLRGGVAFAGKSRWERGILQASVEVGLQDARLWSTESDMTIDGINIAVAMVDLLELRSRPQQQFRFARASLGDFTVENGEIDFQIESKESLLVEKSSFKWAGGSLYSHALRINPGVDSYRVIIFCDRLKLANLLEQFGAAQAEGEGAVSGRIPLVYSDSRLVFGDGFLYSTPGEGGTIRITGGDAIAAGIPQNTPQFAQIDFAMEALKNFSYKWVKLHTVTEDDNLVVKMQLDGMPDRTLPFRYDSRIGAFTRIDLKTEQGILQPIRLDVNFRLPLNTLLDYSKGIGQLIDKMK